MSFFIKALAKLKSWYNPRKFDPMKMKVSLMGVLVNLGIAEVCAYKMVRQDVKAGELPPYVLDILIVAMSIFEALVAPFVSWWGYNRRRTILISSIVVAILANFTWLAMPSPNIREESEYCDAANSSNNTKFVGVPVSTVVRLAVVAASGAVLVMARVGVCSHGLAYTEEYVPDDTSVHFGILLNTRVITLLLGFDYLSSLVETNVTLQTWAIIGAFLFSAVKLPLLIPKAAPEVNGVQKLLPPTDRRGLLQSLGRVCYNPVALSLMLAMGLLAASLWGFAYHELEIIKVKFHLEPQLGGAAGFTEYVKYIFVVLVITSFGDKFSSPILKFSKLKAIKHAAITSVLAIVMFVVITKVPQCELGRVAGLRTNFYVQPYCSLQCGCKPQWDEFSPVCIVEDMLTYLSPCHAGCSNSLTLNEISVFKNCTCAGGGHALAGACSEVGCQLAYSLHQTVFIILATVILLAFQAQGLLMQKIVDVRDKATAFGVAMSVISIMTFVVGHLVYQAIAAANCRWFEGDRCHLRTQQFSIYVGATSAAFAGLSAVVSIISCNCIRVANRKLCDEEKRREFADRQIDQDIELL